MFERIIDRVSDRIMIIREKCRAIVNTDNMPTITIIGVLAVFVIAAAVFIYADPNGRITSRPSKVDHVTIADASYDSVSLRWKASPLANRYIIYRSASEHMGYEKIKTVSDTEFVDEDLNTGEKYWYRVRAANDYRKSLKSKPIYIKPKLQRPSITAISTGDGVHISIEEVPGADGYSVYRDGDLIAKGEGREFIDDDTKVKDASKYTARAYREVEDREVNSAASMADVASRAALNIKLKDFEEVPELVTGDGTYSIQGNITSNATISKIKVGVVGKADDEWVSKKTRYEESEINDKKYDIHAADETIAMETLPAGEYKFVVIAELRDGTEKTLKDQEFTVREPKGGELIAKKAEELAWPAGTSLSKYKYSGGSPTQAYREALDQAYGSRKSWGKQTRAGASCDVFVGTVVRSSGVDTGYPRGLDGVVSHYNNNTDKWELVEDKSEANLMPGDLIFQIYKGNGGHICIYMGDGRVAEAHYVAHGGTYGVIGSYKNSVMSESKCSQYYVYRSKM